MINRESMRTSSKNTAYDKLQISHVELCDNYTSWQENIKLILVKIKRQLESGNIDGAKIMVHHTLEQLKIDEEILCEPK